MRKFLAYTDGSCDNLDPKRPGGNEECDRMANAEFQKLR